ncbi:response regulator [bacterium]|nr:response regulator [bacterium]
MNKVLIFENEYADLEPTFKAINLIYFNEKLDITQYNTSQELGSIANTKFFDVIIIDLDLSLKSQKDGYGILEDIKEYDSNILKQIIVLTGSTKVEEKLHELALENVKISLKPADMDEIAKLIKRIMK